MTYRFARGSIGLSWPAGLKSARVGTEQGGQWEAVQCQAALQTGLAGEPDSPKNLTEASKFRGYDSAIFTLSPLFFPSRAFLGRKFPSHISGAKLASSESAHVLTDNRSDRD